MQSIQNLIPQAANVDELMCFTMEVEDRATQLTAAIYEHLGANEDKLPLFHRLTNKVEEGRDRLIELTEAIALPLWG